MQDEILDEEVISGGADSLNIAKPATRFLTYLIDIIVYYAISFGLGMIAGMGAGEEVSAIASILSLATFFLYYVIMEAAFGKTVGKMVMKTRVVDTNGGAASAGAVILRTICRIVPFEAFSVWMDGNVMWHDKWASTRVIQE